jgi:alkylated DNA repair protein alkB family protein 4
MDAPLSLPDWLAGDRTESAADVPSASSTARVREFDPGRQGVPGLALFSGVRVYPEALSTLEAEQLLGEIEAAPFLPSQSGKQKQHAGPRFNFTRRRMNAERFEGIPAWAHALEARLRDLVARDDRGDPLDLAACRTALEAYETTDAFVLRYFEGERSNLDFHVDDLYAYGEAILDVSLDSDSILTFLGPDPAHDSPAPEPVCVRVPLPARSIAVVYGTARFAWQHAILADDIRGVRTSITLRTLGAALRSTEAGRQVLARARPRP